MIMDAQKEGRPTDLVDALRLKSLQPTTDAERELVESLVDEARRKLGLGGAVAALPTFVASLLAELPGRHAELVVIGAAEATAERVQNDIKALLADGRFRVFDLRGAPDVRGVGALATDVGDAVRMLLIDQATASGWIGRLARSFLDGRNRIEFAQGWVERPPDRSIVIVQYGAVEIDDLAPIIREPIVQFIA